MLKAYDKNKLDREEIKRWGSYSPKKKKKRTFVNNGWTCSEIAIRAA